MNAFPFELPKSLQSHLEFFEMDADKAIKNLERHLKRRGYDAVGYLLLAWFYLKTGDRENALQTAVKAKTFAPGSPFFEHLPYFFEHPSGFDAWLPDDKKAYQRIMRPTKPQNRFFVDIDNLINRLSRVESGKIEVKENTPLPSGKHVRKADDIATETLARIYEAQQQYEKSIDLYRQIALRNPGKEAHCQVQIDRIQGLINSKNTGS